MYSTRPTTRARPGRQRNSGWDQIKKRRGQKHDERGENISEPERMKKIPDTNASMER